MSFIIIIIDAIVPDDHYSFYSCIAGLFVLLSMPISGLLFVMLRKSITGRLLIYFTSKDVNAIRYPFCNVWLDIHSVIKVNVCLITALS